MPFALQFAVILLPMSERQLSPLDRLIAGIDGALRTVASGTRHTARENPALEIEDEPLSDRDRAHSAALMRVNHAGEIAAQGLYQGHAAVARDPATEKQMQQAADEEKDHLGWCEQRLADFGEKPSLLCPLWYAGAFAIGATSGVLGDRWSLGFIEETEKQVCDHLSGHLERLPAEDRKSRAIVSKMRDDEARHGENARAAGASVLPTPVRRMMRLSAKIMTGTAYWI